MKLKSLIIFTLSILFLFGCSMSEETNISKPIEEPITQVELEQPVVDSSISLEDINLPILMYHTVLPDTANSTGNTQPNTFKDHMETIKAAGFNSISPFELVDYLEGKANLPNDPILITFDDGYKDNYTNAYPILKDLDMQATIFTITSRIKHANEPQTPNEFEKITWEDIFEMKETITIQNHTWDMHYQIDKKPKLITPKKNERHKDHLISVQKDLQTAEDKIFEKLGYRSVMLAYPYGAYNQDTMNIAHKVGIRFAVTTKPNVNHLDDLTEKPYELYRITGDGRLTGQELVHNINSYFK